MRVFKQKKIRRVLRHNFSFQSGSEKLDIKKMTLKNKLFGFLSILALISIIGLFIWHPAFKIRIITLTGLERTDYAEVRRTAENILGSQRFGFLPRNNYFLINESELEEIIVNRFFFEAIKITKKFPNSLLIKVYERQPVAIIQKEDSRSLVDSNALIVEKLSQIDVTTSTKNNFPLLVYLDGISSQPEKDKQLVEGVLAWNNFITKSLNVSVINYVIETETSGMIVIEDGWRILANFTENREAQFTALNAAFKQNNFSKEGLRYIDVRYPGRAYWQ